MKVALEPSGGEYLIPKTLLCQQSRYFARMFSGEFSEAKTQSANIKEIEDVLSVQSFEALLQWIHTGQTILSSKSGSPGDVVYAIVELVRLADMCEVGEIEVPAVKFLQNDLTNYQWKGIMRSRAFGSASYLPSGHPVRSIIGKLAAQEFLSTPHAAFREFPPSTLEQEVLQEVHGALTGSDEDVYYVDPITRKEDYTYMARRY